jgi:phosphatidylinositol glycan class S
VRPAFSEFRRRILLAGNPTASTSFIVPQWGGIVIVNPDTDAGGSLSAAKLHSVFDTFRDQLSSLLGVRSLPPNVVLGDKTEVISDWQLDALMRRRALEALRGTQETLSSIVKLVHQIENMPVGDGVRDDIQDSLLALGKAGSAYRTSVNNN